MPDNAMPDNAMPEHPQPTPPGHPLDPFDHPTPTRGYALPSDVGVDGRGAEVRCSNRSTGGSLALYRTVVDGAGPPPHRHDDTDETIHVLEGTMQVECGDDTWTCPAGTTAFLPRHLTHTFRSVDGPATILFIVTPGRLDEFFRMREEGMSPAEAFRAFGGAG